MNLLMYLLEASGACELKFFSSPEQKMREILRYIELIIRLSMCYAEEAVYRLFMLRVGSMERIESHFIAHEYTDREK